MTALEVGLVVAVALLTVVVGAQARSLTAAARRLELLERRVDRRERREAPDRGPVPPAQDAVGAADQGPQGEGPQGEGDAVDIRGADPEGEPTTIPLEATAGPTLVAFLSTTCEICAGLWARLRDGDLATAAPGVLPVVVTKDADLEDVDRIRAFATAGADTSELAVVLSSEAWDDYEVPGSPYVMVVSAAPGSVVTEGGVATWADLVAVARSVSEPRR